MSLVRQLALSILFLPLCADPESNQHNQSHKQLYSAGIQQERSSHWAEAEANFRACRQLPDLAVECTVHHASTLAHLGQGWQAIIELQEFVHDRPVSSAAWTLYARLLDSIASDESAAEAAWQKASSLAPSDPEVWRGFGAFYAEHNRAAKAMDCWTRATKIRPNDPALRAGLAWSLGLAGELKRAEDAFRVALTLNKKRAQPSDEPAALYAIYLREHDRPAEAIPFFNKSCRSGRCSASLLYERALAWEVLGKLRLAQSDALAALRDNPDRRDIRLLLIRTGRSLGDSEMVAEHAGAIEKLANEDAKRLAEMREVATRLDAASSAMQQSNWSAAVAEYNRLVELRPKYSEAWLPLGVALANSGRFDQAAQAFQTYVSLAPLSADGYASLGLLQLQQHQYQAARASLEHALALDPDLAEAASALAHADELLGNLPAAVDILRQSLQKNPSRDLFLQAANAAIRSGDRDSALTLCRQGLARDPDDDGLQTLHAAILLGCADDPVCRAELFRIVPAHPHSAPYLKAAARTYVLLNPFDQKTEQMVNATTARLPSDAQAWLIAAEWNQARNHPAEASDCARKVLALAPIEPNKLTVGAYAILAAAFGSLEHNDDAAQTWQKCWQVNQRIQLAEHEAGLNYALYLEEHDKLPESAEALDQIIKAAPDYAPALLARARQLLRTSNLNESAARAALALKSTRDPSLLEQAHALLAKVYMRLGDTKEAQVHADWIASQH